MTIKELSDIVQGLAALVVALLAALTWRRLNRVAKKQDDMEVKVDVIKKQTDGITTSLVISTNAAAAAEATLAEKEAQHVREGEAAAAVLAVAPPVPTIAVANGCNNGKDPS